MRTNSDLMDIPEVCKYLGCGEDELGQWIELEGFPHHRHGDSLYFLMDEVDTWQQTKKRFAEYKREGGMSTHELTFQLMNTDNVESFLTLYQRNFMQPLFPEFITALAEQRSMSHAEILDRGNININHGHQFFSGKRKPSRDAVIQLAFGFGANITLTQRLLKTAAYSPLYTKIPRDAVIYRCIARGCGLIDTNQLLYEMKLDILGGNKDDK